MIHNKKVAILGGGMLGLTLAYRLAQKGLAVTILEKGSKWGGLAAGFDANGTPLEQYYHHWFKSDQTVQKLIKELGLRDKLHWYPSPVGIWYEQQLYNFSTGLSLLRFRPLPLRDRLRTALVTFFLQKTGNYARFEQVTALDWCKKYYGASATTVIWEPLLKGKFGDAADKISMSWLWARIHDRSSSRPTPFSKERLGYLDGGFQTLIDALLDKCHKLGVEMHSEATLKQYSNADARHTLVWNQAGHETKACFDAVVSTVPGPVFVSLFPINETEQERINAIKYLGATCMILFLKQQFTPYYWLNINDLASPFLAVVEHTNLIDPKLYGNEHIVYIAKYIDPKQELFTKSADELFELYCAYLKKINPAFSKDWVVRREFFKSPFAQHVVSKGYEIPAYTTSIPGLYYANFTQVYPHDRGTNYAVDQANHLAYLITH